MRINELRAIKHVTQEKLAEELNISNEHMNRIERGNRSCSIDLILDMASYFQVSLDYLLTGHDYCNTMVKKRLEIVMDELSSVIHSM